MKRWRQLMKRIICALMIVFMLIYLCSCGSDQNSLQIQNQFSVRDDISDVKYYMQDVLTINTEQLDCLEYYELYGGEAFPILVRYRESGSEDFEYLLSVKAADLDDYLGIEMDDGKTVLYQPIKAKIKTISEEGNYDIKKLTFTLDSNSEDVYVILDKSDNIIRVICQFNHADSDFDAYEFKQENNKKEVFVFEGEYEVLINPKLVLNYQNTEPERSEGYRCSISYSYSFNDDGSLKLFSGAFGDTDKYSYDENGMRKTVIHTKPSDSVGDSFKNEYIRDEQGLIKTVKHYTLDDEKSTYVYTNSYNYSYSNNQIMVCPEID